MSQWCSHSAVSLCIGFLQDGLVCYHVTIIQLIKQAQESLSCSMH